ncbi:MAG: exodeoxyribonuclease VII large subunit [Rickettsiales bacterium]|jgi:exodeoxyribonuclease VII large subunit|nr:exodeoxyribonuclease VII large subunit [Rickettsiales bacterium]
MDEHQIFSVTEISQLLKNTVEQTFSRIKIRGELSGITRAASGHIYLSIKDKDSVINGIIWRGTPVNFDLSDGVEVITTGRLTTYPARSNYQMIISEIEIAGVGSILKMLEERKQKLAREGLFDTSRKKPLPRFPRTIGIVTSPTGAAFQDIQNKLRDRLPVHIILYPVQVQGTTAAAEITAGVRYFNSLPNSSPRKAGAERPDVIIVARGGGALEDLLPFSEEIVVRAVATSEIPVISGVGHEPDWMLIDFAADLRAPTPTGAAEIVVPTKQSLFSDLEKFGTMLKNNFTSCLQSAQMRIDGTAIKSPLQMLADHKGRLNDSLHNLRLSVGNKLQIEIQRINHLGQMLESLSYKNVLRRGYAIVRKGETIISSKNDFSLPAAIEFADGIISAGPDG